MDSKQPRLSPARRSRRCVLNFLACVALVALAYYALHGRALPPSEAKVVVAASSSNLERVPVSVSGAANE